MFRHKALLITMLILMLVAVTACAGQQAPPAEIVKEVEVTREVEVEKTVVVKETVEVSVEATVLVEVTPTSEPEPAEAPLPEIAPDFKDPDTYNVVVGAGEPETMDPSWTYETAGSGVQNNIYEGMVWFNKDKTDEFIPLLSTGWEVSEDGSQWTFDVREGVTFHEGGALEPHDVAYSVHRALLQDRIDGPHWMTLEAFFNLFSIEDLAMEIAGVESFEDVPEEALAETCERVKQTVVADDEAGTVTYNLHQATPWFLSMLANNFLAATMDMEWMVENGAWDGSCDSWVQYHDPAAQDTILFNQANGTGPYILESWTPGEDIVLVRNENYWRADDDPVWEGGPSGLASIPRVVIKLVNEWGTRLAMLEAGDADWIYVPSQYRPQLEPFYNETYGPDGTLIDSNPNGYVQAWRDLPLVAMTPAQFNWNINVEGGNPFVGSGELDGNGVSPDFFSDIHVRKAFNYCFDFEAMIQDALNGEGVQAQGPIIQGMMGYREGEDPLYHFDLDKCEEEFQQAWDGEVWDKGFYMQLAYNTGNDTRRLASEILKAGIESVNPDFNVAVVGMPWPVMLNQRRAQKLPLYVGGWQEDFHDPHNWVHPFLHSQGAYGRVINMTEPTASEFDDLILQGASSADTEVRRPIYENIQLKAQEDAVVIWMYQAVGRQHFQPWIKGFYYNPAYNQASYSYVYALSK